MMRARCIASILVAVLAGAICTGCSKGGGVRSGDTLVLASPEEPQSLNPLLLEGPIAGMVGSLVFSYLVTDGPNGDPVPDVATEVPTIANGGISSDGLHVTYHLRHDVYWQDGVKLTARDCVFTYRAIVNPNNLIPTRYGFDDIASITAPDDYTLELTLKSPTRSSVRSFLALDGNYAIVPEHLLAKYPSINRIDFNTHPIGSGPYRVVEWMRGDHLLLQANPRYFRGAPAIEHLRIDFIPDFTTILNQLRTGEIDAAFEVDPALYQEARTIPGTRVVLTPVTGMGAIVMNAQDGPTSDLRVREAIASALNAPAIVAKASHGAYLARNGRIALLRLPASADAQSPPYDPAHARALLAAAGWRIAPGGIRMKNGAALRLTLVSTPAEPMSNAVTVLVQAELRAIGIDVAIRSYAAALYKAPAAAGGPVFGGHYSLAYLLITTGGDGDLSFLYDCTQRPPVGFDISRICDPRIDALVDAAGRLYDPAAVQRDNRRLESLLEEDIPEIVLYQPRRVSVLTTRLEGYSPSPVVPYTRSWQWTLR
jgi:peptide/nickel transport system substrate-binding protein